MKNDDSPNPIRARVEWPPALDALVAASGHHQLLLENDDVRILDARIPPGDAAPVHTHRWPGFLYVVSFSDFVRYDPGGSVLMDSRTMAAKPEAGMTLWADPLPPHWIQNVGNRDLHVIATELKRGRARGRGP